MKAKVLNKVSAALVSAALVAMLGPAGSAAAPKDKTLDDIRWKTGRTLNQQDLEQGLNGMWKAPVLVYAANEAQWTEVMNQMAGNGELDYRPPVPEGVDWSRQSVVLISLGSYPDYRYNGVQINEVRLSGRKLLVDVSVEPGQPNMAISTAPYHLVVVDCCGQRAPGLKDRDSLPVRVSVRTSTAAAGSGAPEDTGDNDNGSTLVELSWGAVKGEYR
jgi:hypothetical protein